MNKYKKAMMLFKLRESLKIHLWVLLFISMLLPVAAFFYLDRIAGPLLNINGYVESVTLSTGNLNSVSIPILIIKTCSGETIEYGLSDGRDVLKIGSLVSISGFQTKLTKRFVATNMLKNTDYDSIELLCDSQEE